MEWGLVRRVQRDDRRSITIAQRVWEMFTLVAAQRKRPNRSSSCDAAPLSGGSLAALGGQGETPAALGRFSVSSLLTFLTLMERLAERFRHQGLPLSSCWSAAFLAVT